MNESRSKVDPIELLAQCRTEHEGDIEFENRVMRRVRLERRPRSITYWMPTIVGAVTAAAALLAILQILTFAPHMEPIELDGIKVDASSPSFPNPE